VSKGKAVKKAVKGAPKAPKANGRPSVYTPELASLILARMAAGDTLRTICESDGMPSPSTIKQWAIDDKPAGFSDRYARAREFQADAIAEEALEIADRAPVEDAAKTRIRVDARKWLASKLNPAKFGDRTRLEGADGKPLIPAAFTFSLDLANSDGESDGASA
jgi:hypothetical protein